MLVSPTDRPLNSNINMKASLLALALATSTTAQDKPHCPQLKYENGQGGTISLLQSWKGVVLSAPIPASAGNLTQADVTASFGYVAATDTLSANVTYTNKNLSPATCSGHFEVGCIASTPLDYVFKYISGDPCMTGGAWKCNAFLTGDDFQKEHAFAFGMEFNYDSSPASAPYSLRGSPLGTFFTGCDSTGGPAWTQRALQYRLEPDTSSAVRATTE